MKTAINMNNSCLNRLSYIHSCSTDNVVKALLYTAEAYHTRGAIRHVVQGIQMKAIDSGEFNTPLLTYDLWASMIEDRGDGNKEYIYRA